MESFKNKRPFRVTYGLHYPALPGQDKRRDRVKNVTVHDSGYIIFLFNYRL